MNITNESLNQTDHANVPAILVGIGIALIIVTGLIHFVEAPDNYTEAAYKGIMFALNGLGALVAAYGIYRGSKTVGWGLGFLVAGGAIAMYVVSRTIGLPGLGVDDEWLEPMGVLSVLVEGAFVLLSGFVTLRYLLGERQPAQQAISIGK